ncbi:MAG: hypothetical protein ACI4E1_09505 [Lachnospira sp.]
MDEIREQQLEVLQNVIPYSERVLAAIDDVIEQLQSGKHDAEFINQILEAINWIIEVYNGTKTLVNPEGNALDESLIKAGITSLERTRKFKDDAGIADSLYQIGLFIKKFHDVASEISAN